MEGVGEVFGLHMVPRVVPRGVREVWTNSAVEPLVHEIPSHVLEEVFRASRRSTGIET